MKINIKKYMLLLVAIPTCSCSIFETSSQQSNVHNHTYSESYSYDETSHWYETTCGHNVVNKEDHNIIDKVCKECGFVEENDKLLFNLKDDNTYEVVGRGTESSEEIYIASFYNDLAVTSIADKAFFNDLDVTSVIISSKLEKICNYTFTGCTNLTNVYLPNSITYIGDLNFMSCKLEKIIIPSSVDYLGDSNFIVNNNLSIYCEDEQLNENWSNVWNYDYRKVYFYSDTDPITNGNFWKYDENKNVFKYQDTYVENGPELSSLIALEYDAYNCVGNGGFYAATPLYSISFEASKENILTGTSTITSTVFNTAVYSYEITGVPNKNLVIKFTYVSGQNISGGSNSFTYSFSQILSDYTMFAVYSDGTKYINYLVCPKNTDSYYLELLNIVNGLMSSDKN